MAEIVIMPPNPFDFEESEIDELASALQAEDPSFTYSKFVPSERGYGNDLQECLDLVIFLGGAGIKGAASAAGGAALKRAVTWARARWQNDKKSHPGEGPRPRMVRLIYGPDGEVLRRVYIDDPDGEPRDVDSDRP